jgi:hypothetical protein
MQAEPNADIDFQFFHSDECDPSGFGEGKVPFGYSDLPADPDGDIDFDLTLPDSAPVGSFVTALAYANPAGTNKVNTSEFSNCVEVTAPSSPTPTPTGPTPSPTAEPTELTWGDLLCDGQVDTMDALAGLWEIAGLGTFSAAGGTCPQPGEAVNPMGFVQKTWGDHNCDGVTDSEDQVAVLMEAAGVPGKPPDLGCPEIGAPLQISG